MPRDDFSDDTVRKLGERVNLRCSNPGCRAQTKGPHTSDEKAVNVGVAAHISGASQGGPRHDASQSPEERSAIGNGIWLCSVCAKLVDSDVARFPAEVLRAWKTLAEHEAREGLGRPLGVPAAAVPSVELTLGYKKTLVRSEIHRYELLAILKNVGTRRLDDWNIEVEFPTLLVQEPGTIIATRIADRSDRRTSFFRTSIRKTLYPGDSFVYGFPYRVDREVYCRILDDGQRLFDELAKARAFVDGAIAAEVSRPVRELQDF